MLAGRRTFRFRVATLNHEVLNHTMKQSAVIVALANQLKHVVTMFWSLVIKAHNDVALLCFDFYLCHSSYNFL